MTPAGDGRWYTLEREAEVRLTAFLCALAVLACGYVEATQVAAGAWTVEEMFIASGFSGFFLLGAICLGWASYGRSYRWNALWIEVKPVLRPPVSHALADIDFIDEREGTRMCEIGFQNGAVLRFSTRMKGAPALIAAAQAAWAPRRRAPLAVHAMGRAAG